MFQSYQKYDNGIKSQIKVNGSLSASFQCQLGVRQGENLSSFLFSVYLNDLESYLSMHNINGLNDVTEMMENELHTRGAFGK